MRRKSVRAGEREMAIEERDRGIDVEGAKKEERQGLQGMMIC